MLQGLHFPRPTPEVAGKGIAERRYAVQHIEMHAGGSEWPKLGLESGTSGGPDLDYRSPFSK
jgi:hypothetical protein